MDLDIKLFVCNFCRVQLQLQSLTVSQADLQVPLVSGRLAHRLLQEVQVANVLELLGRADALDDVGAVVVDRDVVCCELAFWRSAGGHRVMAAHSQQNNRQH